MSLKDFLLFSRYSHGLAALLVATAFYYHGALGLVIRSHRKRGSVPAKAIKRHRRLGPVLMVLVLLVYAGGLLIAYLGGIEKGSYSPSALLRNPLHLSNGTLLVAALLVTFRISKKIRGREPSPFRQWHFRIGVAVLALLALQVLLGLAILL